MKHENTRDAEPVNQHFPGKYVRFLRDSLSRPGRGLDFSGTSISQGWLSMTIAYSLQLMCEVHMSSTSKVYHFDIMMFFNGGIMRKWLIDITLNWRRKVSSPIGKHMTSSTQQLYSPSVWQHERLPWAKRRFRLHWWVVLVRSIWPLAIFKAVLSSPCP